MTPAELDIVTNGAFIYEGASGKRFASLDYKLRDMGMKIVGRSGPLASADLQRPSSELINRLNAELAEPSA